LRKGEKGYFSLPNGRIIPKRRSVEKDYGFFDPPDVVWEKINYARWDYAENEDFYHLRDLALMCLLYMTASRVREICRFSNRHVKGPKAGTIKAPSVTKDQFVILGDLLAVRNLRVIKRRNVKSLSDYGHRPEIYLPLKGDLSVFTKPVVEYLEYLEPNEELFKFGGVRAYQIVTYCTGGEFPHYLREMGLKMWLRVYGFNIVQLQTFSGHKRVENLIRYLKEAEAKKAGRRAARMSFEDFRQKG